jgi:ribosomal protein S18 acetylase RimI-like enzyme
MRVGTLETTSFEALCAAFDRAFGGYAVPFPPSAGFLGEMMRRRGVRLELSIGVFLPRLAALSSVAPAQRARLRSLQTGPGAIGSGGVEDAGELVGLTLNGLGRWQGAITGYDCGTAVVPAHRGRGLAAVMLEETLALVGAAGATRYLLEVLEANAPAIRVYRRAGFEVTRVLRCFELDEAPPAASIPVVEEAGHDAAALAAMRDVEPSWQNGDESIARAGAPRVTLAVRDADGLAGCAVLFPGSNDLAQLAVAHRARTMRILNVDERDPGPLGFLAAAGARETVRQLEMVRPIG